MSVTVLLIIGRQVAGDQEPLFSPFLLFVGILLYAIAANICYTFGWLAELVLHKFGNTDTAKFATSAFRIGLGLSCVVSSLPIWFVLTLWVSHF